MCVTLGSGVSLSKILTIKVIALLPWSRPLNPKVLALVLQWFALLLKFVLSRPVKGCFFYIEKSFPDQYILIDSQWFLPLARQILGEYSEIRKRPEETCTA